VSAPPRLTATFLAAHVVLPLLVGGGIYLAWRDTSLLMFHWLDAVGGLAPLHPLRVAAAPLRPSLPDWLLFSVPDGAWVYACVAFFGRLWLDGPRLARAFWTGLGPALAIGGEVGQIVGLVPGTFDVADVVWYAAAGVVAAVFAAAPWRKAPPTTVDAAR
jgi:hypothetical protein